MRGRLSEKDLEQSKIEDVDETLKAEQQAWTGVLGWLHKTQRQLSVVFSELSRNNTSPTTKSVLSTKKACAYAKETYKPLTYVGVDQPAIVWWVDGSYSFNSCDGRLGWEVQILSESVVEEALKRGSVGLASLPELNIVAWKSIRDTRGNLLLHLAVSCWHCWIQ